MKGIKRITLFFTIAFAFVTILCISSLIVVMTLDDQDMDNDAEIIESKEEEQSSEYWTEKRMQEAEPVQMPTVSTTDIVKEIVTGSLPILIILFLVFTFSFIFIIVRKIKLLEKQNGDILNELSNMNDRSNDKKPSDH